MKLSAFMISVILGVSSAISQEVEANIDQWGAVRADTYTSVIDGKSVMTRISPKFIDCGVKWIPGDKIPIKIKEVSAKAKTDVIQRYGKKWTLVSMGFNSYGENINKWLIQLIFNSDEGDIVVILSNLQGDLWPHGKVYDEFN